MNLILIHRKKLKKLRKLQLHERLVVKCKQKRGKLFQAVYNFAHLKYQEAKERKQKKKYQNVHKALKNFKNESTSQRKRNNSSS